MIITIIHVFIVYNKLWWVRYYIGKSEKKVKSINITCTFDYPAKYEPYLNNEIDSYVECLPKNIAQNEIKIFNSYLFMNCI